MIPRYKNFYIIYIIKRATKKASNGYASHSEIQLNMNMD